MVDLHHPSVVPDPDCPGGLSLLQDPLDRPRPLARGDSDGRGRCCRSRAPTAGGLFRPRSMARSRRATTVMPPCGCTWVGMRSSSSFCRISAGVTPKRSAAWASVIHPSAPPPSSRTPPLRRPRAMVVDPLRSLGPQCLKKILDLQDGAVDPDCCRVTAGMVAAYSTTEHPAHDSQPPYGQRPRQRGLGRFDTFTVCPLPWISTRPRNLERGSRAAAGHTQDAHISPPWPRSTTRMSERTLHGKGGYAP